MTQSFFFEKKELIKKKKSPNLTNGHQNFLLIVFVFYVFFFATFIYLAHECIVPIALYIRVHLVIIIIPLEDLIPSHFMNNETEVR